ncbi:contractile injection system tape measure protein [Flavobacterium sp.]|uniref:contractile injection system tape measure protein n=1 Tax=Flavobacterium sp. TaxID=239 RepID=UPI0040478B8E
MASTVNHIISKFKWENSFNQKENATELQQRISRWSNTKMQKEINSIFDEICPDSQTWCIQSLTLDLGTIDYDTLEEDLSQKLFHQLSDTLIELILNAKKGSDGIEILNTDTSQINRLSHYLMTGTMPWNYKDADYSINEMMTSQFKNNKDAIITMLQKVGKTDEKVRQRMAWQLQESIIIKIIEGLETSNHDQIIKFSKELTKIQQHQILVPANENDFKRNLWFWIVNYLFTDRGTIFNKVTFMKSSIQQMANHYNVAYSELLNMIELAIQQIHVTASTKADFILILNLLTKENELFKAKKTSETILQENDHWENLTALIHSVSLRKDNIKKREFNELVIALSKENKNRFRDLFSSLGSANHFWNPVVEDLQNEALEHIFHAVLPVQSKMLIESIYFIEKLYKEMNVKLDSSSLWEIGIQFLIHYKNSPFDNKTFLTFTITALSKKNNELKQNILEKLTNSNVPSSSKTIASLEIYTNLTAILKEEVYEKNSLFNNLNFGKLIDELLFQIQANQTNSTASIIVQKTILSHIHNHTERTFYALLNYKNKSSLKLLFPYILNKKMDALFIKRTKNTKIALLKTFKSAIKDLNKSHSFEKLNLSIAHSIYNLGIRIILLHPEYTAIQFIEALLENLFVLATTAQKTQFDEFVSALFKHEKVQNIPSSTTYLEKIKTKLLHTKPKTIRKDKNITAPIITEPVTILLNGQTISVLKLYEWIEKMIQNETLSTTENNHKFKLNDLLQAALEINPQEIQRILSNCSLTDSRIKIIQKDFDWHFFSLWISNNRNTNLYEAMETLRSFYEFISHFITIKDTSTIEFEFWKTTWKVIQQNENSTSIVKSFITHWMDVIIKEKALNSSEIIATINTNALKINPTLEKILIAYNTPLLSSLKTPLKNSNEDIKHCEKQGQIEALFISLITERKVPKWFHTTEKISAVDLFHEALEQNPTSFIVVYKQNKIPQLQKQQLHNWIDFRKTIAIIKTNTKNTQQLHRIEQLYNAFTQLTIKGIRAKEIQTLLFRKTILAWTENNWSLLTVDTIWQELLWELCQKKNIPAKEIIDAFSKIKYSLPPALHVSLNQLIKSETKASTETKNTKLKTQKNILLNTLSSQKSASAIPIKNAGIVLLNNYIEMLMDRLGLLEDNQFKNKSSQLNAVHYLQYVITGLTKTDEALLPLNKVLCGLSITTPIMDSISITEEEIKLINGLINAAISHWPSVGDTSLLGFRGNWLVRDGLLIEKEDRWELTVEKRVYDLLLHKSPFSFSIIKYPWMEKPIHVSWPY